MTPTTLQALRRLLFFSRPEAAILVAASPERPEGVSDRAWRMWEDGERPVPADVAERIGALAQWRERAIKTASDAIAGQTSQHGQPAGLALVWYDTLDDWATREGREPVLWRPQQSACAALLAAYPGTIRLVRFDPPAYAAWLGRRKDSEAMRGAWAAQVSV